MTADRRESDIELPRRRPQGSVPPLPRNSQEVQRAGRYGMDILDPIENCVKEALGTVHRFITEVTGTSPTQEELADALKRYFVLNEIREHIEMVREPEE